MVHWTMKVLRACILFTYWTSLSWSRLNEEARKLIAELGSTSITNLGFRDNWVFCGGKGIKTKSPFEQVCDSMTYWNLTAYVNKGIACFINTMHLFKMGIYCSSGIQCYFQIYSLTSLLLLNVQKRFFGDSQIRKKSYMGWNLLSQ